MISNTKFCKILEGNLKKPKQEVYEQVLERSQNKNFRRNKKQKS